MANPWFKMHADFYHDPKVQTMSEAMQRRLLMLFCLRCSDDLDCLTDDEIRCALRISARQWQATKALFIEKGFIDEDLGVCNWNKRQHIDDETGQSAEERRREKDRQRLQAWRERQREGKQDGQESETDETPTETFHETSVKRSETQGETVSETPMKRGETASETDTETDTETDETAYETGRCPVSAPARETPPETHLKHGESVSGQMSPSTKPPKAVRKKTAPTLGVDAVVALGAERQHAEDWLAARRAKHAPLTPTALEGLQLEAGKAGITVREAVQVCAENSWRGFKASWFANLNNRTNNLARASPQCYEPGEPIPLVRGATMQSAEMAKQLIFGRHMTPETVEKDHAAI